MKALIFDGSRVGETDQEPLRGMVEEELTSADWDVQVLQLRDIDIAHCNGCFECWTKTPGICVIDDAARGVTEELVNCRLFVILTPVTFGGYSSEVKKALDRSLGWMLPYFTTIEGKTHHKPRYKHYPDLVAIGTTPGPDQELEALFHDVVDRNALNAHSPRHAAVVVAGGTGLDEQRALVRDLLKTVGVVQ
jgi:multimeric flavodoxin WrbA